MKATKTPTMKLEVKHDNDLLRSNGIYMAGTDNRIVYVDDLFDQMPVIVKRYLLLHEEGHIIAEHPHKRTLSQELEADKYAMKKMGKSITFKVLRYLIKVFMNIDWTVSAAFTVRLADLGYRKAKGMTIIAPNGLRFDVNTIRRYL